MSCKKNPGVALPLATLPATPPATLPATPALHPHHAPTTLWIVNQAQSSGGVKKVHDSSCRLGRMGVQRKKVRVAGVWPSPWPLKSRPSVRPLPLILTVGPWARVGIQSICDYSSIVRLACLYECSYFPSRYSVVSQCSKKAVRR